MKLRFLCANHREWLCSQPHQAVHRCANSFETGWQLFQGEHWAEALPHLGCAFETAEILLTTRAMAPARAVEWFMHSLSGLTQTLDKLGRTSASMEVHQAAIDRLRREAAREITPELEGDLYRHITRLNRDRRRIATGMRRLAPTLMHMESPRGKVVLH
jgi:hypothetical protein